MTFRTEFPDFAPDTMPEIPHYWRDTSWKNDTCPSFSFGRFRVFIDYADPADREFEESERFSVHDADEIEKEGATPPFGTDDWSAVLERVGAPDPKALAFEAFNLAVRHIQEALNVDAGDFAGIWFSGERGDDIERTLAAYAAAEIKGYL